ncbi:hypothetical protein J4733_28925 [Klebsiella pneumoniae]|uniref:Uncharacterized protein n=1 Tax=Klebsiella pneumoniae TaxID=573 RepID=A0A939SS68_KLEPN|nr:hypothetical protein [Klebsiella pneumoniae]
MAAAPYRARGTAGQCKLSRPGKRRAARQQVFRPRSRLMPRWRLRLTGPGYGRPVQAQQAGQAPRRPARCAGRVPVLMAQPALAEQAGETLEHQQSAVVVKAEGLGAQRVDAFACDRRRCASSGLA